MSQARHLETLDYHTAGEPLRILRGGVPVIAGERLTIESIIGTSFTVECVGETKTGGLAAVLTRVTGSAYMTGEHKFVLDGEDPLKQGFFIR